jgi:serine/threonine protein kinase
MKNEQWDKIEELFNSALDIDPVDREAYLKEKCGGDEALYLDVVSLLNEDNQLHDLLKESTPGIDIRALTQNEFENRLIGKTLGEYTIESVIASGGMGTVYLANRSDGAFEQKVAIKLIHPSLSSANFMERFRQERQILAKLNHPNIARLLDGGVTDDGLPFLVMELVTGRPLNQHIQNHSLAIDEKLKLFLRTSQITGFRDCKSI